MTRSIAYFPSQCAQNSGPVIQALLHSLHHAGMEVQANSMDCDAAIIWSVLWAGRMSGNKSVYEHYRSQNRPVIVADIGTLIRGVTWKIALDNITARGWYGHTQDLDLDRPKKLGLVSRCPTHARDGILIAAQHRHSLQTADIDMELWITLMYNELRKHTDRPVILRPHPRSSLVLSRLPAALTHQKPLPLANTYDSFDFDTNWHAIVNYNSGPGILAAISGTRPVVHASSLAAPVAISIEHVERPYTTDRDRWLLEIAHTEYTLEEIQQGQWLKRIGPRLFAPR